MPIIRTLIPRIDFLPTLAPLTCGLTISLVAALDSKVTPLIHLLQSNRDLAWSIKSLLASLVTQILVWLVGPTRLFIILLCHHSLTYPCTPDQYLIGMHLMIMPHRMSNRRQGLKLLRTPIIHFLMIVDKGGRIGIKASRSISESPRSRKEFPEFM
jgi:hypothetical protein